MLHLRTRLVRLLACAVVVAVLTGCGDIPTERVHVVPPTNVAPSTEAPTKQAIPLNTTTTTTTTDQAGTLRAVNAFFGAAATYAAAAGTGHSVRPERMPSVAHEPPAAVAYPTSVVPVDLVEFARCVIGHESARAGVYRAVSANGVWRGAYQMDAAYWRAYAPVEWRFLAGVHETAPPEVQDAAFVAGYRARGASPWNGSRC